MARRNGPQLDGDVPLAFIQTAQPGKAVRKKRDHARRVVNGVIAFIIIATLFNALALVVNYRTSESLSASVNDSSSPSFKSRYEVLGAQVIESWLSADQPVVDTAEGLTWPTLESDTVVGVNVVSVGYLGGQTVPLSGSNNYHESLKYSVVAADGSQFIATIDMGIVMHEDGSVSPVLLSAPFVEPRQEVAVVSGMGPDWAPFGVKEGSGLETQISQWVQAWTANDTSGLKSLTGDTSSASYQGLTSEQTWLVVEGSTTVPWSAVRPDDGNVVVRVVWDIETDVPTADLAAPVTPVPGTEPEVVKVTRIRQSVDLLIADADSGLPRVLAWGAPGSNLVAGQNAIESKG